MLINILLIIHILVALAIIVLVLLQQGKGSDMGAAFGGGAGSQTLFGSRGSATFLSRLTGGLAAIFFVGSLALAWLYVERSPNASVVDDREIPSVSEDAAGGDVTKDESVPSVDTDTDPNDTSDTTQSSSSDTDVPAVPVDSADGDTPADQNEPDASTEGTESDTESKSTGN